MRHEKLSRALLVINVRYFFYFFSAHFPHGTVPLDFSDAQSQNTSLCTLAHYRKPEMFSRNLTHFLRGTFWNLIWESRRERSIHSWVTWQGPNTRFAPNIRHNYAGCAHQTPTDMDRVLNAKTVRGVALRRAAFRGCAAVENHGENPRELATLRGGGLCSFAVRENLGAQPCCRSC